MQHLFFQTIFNFSDLNKEIWQMHLAIIFLLFYLRNTAGCSSVSVDSLKLFFCKSHVVPAVPRRAQTAPLTFWKMYESVHDAASTTWSNHAILPVAAFPWNWMLLTWFFSTVHFLIWIFCNVYMRYTMSLDSKILEICAVFFIMNLVCNGIQIQYAIIRTEKWSPPNYQFIKSIASFWI